MTRAAPDDVRVDDAGPGRWTLPQARGGQAHAGAGDNLPADELDEGGDDDVEDQSSATT